MQVLMQKLSVFFHPLPCWSVGKGEVIDRSGWSFTE